MSEKRPPTSTLGTILFGLSILAVAIGGFGGWAAFAELSSAVVSSGTVKVLSNRKTVQTLQGGIVEEILVRNGDRVRKGDVIVRMDKTRAAAQVGILRGNFDAARAVLARLIAERDGEEFIQFPEDMVARRDDPTVFDILNGQKKLARARREGLDGETNILIEQIGQLHEEIAGLESQAAAKRDQIDLIHDELKGLQELFDKGHAPRTRLLALQREASSLKGEEGEFKAATARTKGRISELRLQIVQLRKSFGQEVLAELRDREQEVRDLQERIGASEFDLAQMNLKATEDGIIVGMGTHTVGGVLQPGETLMEIVPGDDKLIVEVEILPQDIDAVQIGQVSDIQFTAFSQRTTPKMMGHVVYVSADRITEQETGKAYFTARVEIAEEERGKLEGLTLLPGMPADVMIQTGSRTPLDYLTKPITDSMRKAWREE